MTCFNVSVFILSGSQTVTDSRQITSLLCFVLQNFIDSLRVHVRGGVGGQGYPKYSGIGGRGGDIYAVGDENSTLNNLKKLCPTKRFHAPKGEDSRLASCLQCSVGTVTVSK